MRDKTEAQVIKCEMCGSVAHREVIDYHVEDMLGVRVGIVRCVEKITCDSCAEEFITIPDVNGLIAAAAVARSTMLIRINGKEVRFLRKAIDLSAKDFAEILQVRPETVSRWENGKEQIGVAEEKVLRMLVGKALKGKQDKAPGIAFDEKTILEATLRADLRVVDGKPLMVFHREAMHNEEEVWDIAA